MLEPIIIFKIIAYIAFTISLVVLAVKDIKTFRIPNNIVFPLILGSIIFAFICYPVSEALLRIACIVLLFFFGATRLLGLGDIKLIMALVAFMGFVPAMITVAIASVLSLIINFLKDHKNTTKCVKQGLIAFSTKTLNIMPVEEADKVPFAPYILVSFLIVSIGRYILNV